MAYYFSGSGIHGGASYFHVTLDYSDMVGDNTIAA